MKTIYFDEELPLGTLLLYNNNPKVQGHLAIIGKSKKGLKYQKIIHAKGLCNENINE